MPKQTEIKQEGQMNRIEEAVKFLGLGMTEIKEDDGYYFITPKYKKVFKDKFSQLFPQPLDKKLRDDEFVAELEIILTRHSETLECGFTGIRYKETQSGPDSSTYATLAREIYSALLQLKIEEAYRRGYQDSKYATKIIIKEGRKLIEEARKQERERIISEIESHALKGKGSFSKTVLFEGCIEISPKYPWWQALKGGE